MNMSYSKLNILFFNFVLRYLNSKTFIRTTAVFNVGEFSRDYTVHKILDYQ